MQTLPCPSHPWAERGLTAGFLPFLHCSLLNLDSHGGGVWWTDWDLWTKSACFYVFGRIMCTGFCTLVAGANILDSWDMGLFGECCCFGVDSTGVLV